MVTSRALLIQAGMKAEARGRTLRSGDYVLASEIAYLAGYSETNPGAQPNRWRREGAIFAIEHHGAHYFPLFGLNPEEGYRPYPAMREVLETFDETRGDWSIALWFAAGDSLLDDQRPQDLLAGEPGSVISAAREEMEGLQHG